MLPSHLCCHCQILADFGEFVMIEVSFHVQPYIKWTLRIHKRMIMMSFIIKSHLDLCLSPKTVWELPSHLCCHFQIQTHFGDFGMIEVSMHVQLLLRGLEDLSLASSMAMYCWVLTGPHCSSGALTLTANRPIMPNLYCLQLIHFQFLALSSLLFCHFSFIKICCCL